MKRAFIVLNPADFENHSHKLFKGKEFVNEGEVIETVRDYNRDTKNPDSKVFGEKAFTGEILIVQTLTF